MKPVCGGDFLKKQPIARHGKVNASSGKNKPVVTTERGNHDRPGHAHRARMTEDGVHHHYRDAILWRALDFRKRQHGQIRDVSQQIKYDHNAATAYKRTNEIFTRVTHFTA